MFLGISPLWYYRLASNSPFWKHTLKGFISVMPMLTISKALWNSQKGLSDHQPSKTLAKAWRKLGDVSLPRVGPMIVCGSKPCSLFPCWPVACSASHSFKFSRAVPKIWHLSPSFFWASFRAPVYWGISFQSGELLALSLCQETWTYLQGEGCNWWLCTASPSVVQNHIGKW